MSDAKRIRVEVERRIKSVNAKIARTKKATGANIAGTEFDPRRRMGIEKNYNVKQLTNYLSSLNEFMRRGNQFVSGVKGAPIPRGAFKLYKGLESEYRAAGEAHDAAVGGLNTPTGMTVRQNKAMVPEAAGSAVYGPYRKLDRESTDIASAGALKKLTRDMVNKLKPDYLENKISEGRENIEKALIIMGDEEYLQQIRELSDYQFDAMWFGTNFAEAAFMKYHAEQERAAGTRKEKWQDKRIDSAFDDLGSLLSWAREEVPREAP